MSDPNPNPLQMGGTFASQIRVRDNVLTPALWLSGASVIPFLLATIVREQWIRNIALGIGFLCFLVPIAGYVYFAIRQPDRLQSETYLLRREEFQMLKQGQVTSEPIVAANTPASANPSLALPPPNVGSNQ